MGCRATVDVVEGRKGVTLYTHWYGHDLPSVVQCAMRSANDRWGCAPYLARAIFSRMVPETERLESIGFGIWVAGGMESEFPRFKVDCAALEVTIGKKKWTFREFCDIPDVSWES